MPLHYVYRALFNPTVPVPLALFKKDMGRRERNTAEVFRGPWADSSGASTALSTRLAHTSCTHVLHTRLGTLFGVRAN